jgi:integrase
MEKVKKKRKAMKMPNGYGSITKMSGRRRKPWRVRVTSGWTPEGKQQYKNIGTYASRAEAMDALAAWNVNPHSSAEKAKREQIAQGLTFADMYDLLVKYRGDNLTDSLRAAYSSGYKNLEPLHQLQFLQIKKPQLQDAFNACKKSSATKNKMKMLVNAIYKYAVEHEITEKDYSKMVDMEPTKNAKDHDPFTEEEIATIWMHADAGDDTAKIILIQIYTGCRIEELLQLEKANINLPEQYAIGGLKTEAGKDRIIPFHDRIVPLVEYFYNQDRPFLFVNTKGMRLKYIPFYRLFNLRMNDWGMKHTSHDARRTLATRLHVADVPYSIIQQIMGHASKDVTGKHYISKNAKHLLKHVNKLK